MPLPGQQLSYPLSAPPTGQWPVCNSPCISVSISLVSGCFGLHGVPPRYVHSLPPKPMNVTLFGNRVFAGDIEVR